MRAPLLLPLLAAVASSLGLPAQDGPPPNGPRDVDPGWHALVGARVLVAPGRTLDAATIVIRDGRVASVGAGPAPDGARVHDCAGLTIHAAWIDAHVPVAVPRPPADAPGSHWHADVLPQRSALAGDGLPEERAAGLRKLGFGTAAIFPEDGLIRGTSAVVTLERLDAGHRRRVLADRTHLEVVFGRGTDGYPRSLMGAVALVRQALADAAGDAARSDGPSPAGAALGALRDAPPILFHTRDEVDLLRAARVLAEFGRLDGAALLGTGTEFRRLDPIAALGRPIVLPLAFPDAPDVESVHGAETVSLRDMRTWELAPENPARLVAAGLPIALTTDRGKTADFVANLAEAIARGLDRDAALAALTTVPAQLLGIADRVGTVETGRLANLTVVDGDPFDADREVRAVWIAGVHHEVEPDPGFELEGVWAARFEAGGVRVDELRFASAKKLELISGERRVAAKRVARHGRRIDASFDAGDLGGRGTWRLTGLVQGRTRLSGIAMTDEGSSAAWTATRTGDLPPKDAAGDGATDGADRGAAAGDAAAVATEGVDALAARLAEIPAPRLPLGAFGRDALPPRTDVLVTGATIWTSGPAGIVRDGVLLVRDGRIAYVGPDHAMLQADGALRIDGRGLHVTPGLIDCHSHTGISGGVNEGTQAVTAEVRIGDVIDPDDISWYRQLASGVTAVNQLHGSANPIGGQNSVVKIRWGVADPEDMKLEGARPGIKFALGENVKRSSSSRNDRYPNTRMGVEALLRERFTAAREYAAARDAGRAPRRDLELDALAEILAGERLVHCHAYRQDEILMLCRMAEEFGFRIGTFQHGLEGYKVADAIRGAAIGASIFSDWWAYKYEVVDAIPDNAAIMTRVGVNVSFNSDSDELARRLNTEAAKAVKYGGLAPADALRLVTINPATQLAVADRIGSLETGKDADFVLWSGDPLSTLTRCLQTWIDGRRYFDDAEDAAERQRVRSERARLIQAILADPGPRARGGGSNGSDARPGECGCYDLEGLR